MLLKLLLLPFLFLFSAAVIAQQEADFNSWVAAIVSELDMERVPKEVPITVNIRNESRQKIAEIIVKATTARLEYVLLSQKFLVVVPEHCSALFSLQQLSYSALFDESHVPQIGKWRPARAIILGRLWDTSFNRICLQIYLVNVETGLACGGSQKVIRISQGQNAGSAERAKVFARLQEKSLYERLWANAYELEKRTQKLSK